MTYRIGTGKDLFDVEEWQPASYLPIGEQVSINVYVQCFVRGKGGAAYRLCKVGSQDNGESF